MKKERSRVGRGPEADPEAAKPDVLVPKSCLHFILFHQRLTMRTHCHSRRSAILLLMYLHHAVYSNSKLRSTRSLNSDWPDNLMARRAESFDWSTCMHAQRHIPIICLGFEAVLSHSWSCQKGFVLLTTAFCDTDKITVQYSHWSGHGFPMAESAATAERCRSAALRLQQTRV